MKTWVVDIEGEKGKGGLTYDFCVDFYLETKTSHSKAWSVNIEKGKGGLTYDFCEG